MTRTLDSDNRRIRHGWPAALAEIYDLEMKIERLEQEKDCLRQMFSELQSKNGITGGTFEELYRLRAENKQLRLDLERANSPIIDDHSTDWDDNG